MPVHTMWFPLQAAAPRQDLMPQSSALFSATTSAETPRQPVSFNSLPAEIRDEIWLYTLAPRLIYIHPHERLSPPHCDPVKNIEYEGWRVPVSVRFNHTVYSPAATPAMVFKAYAKFAMGPVGSGQYSGKKKTILEKAYIKATRPLQYKSSPPPAALYVCSESRAVALRAGYVMAFKGRLLQHPGEAEGLEPWVKFLDGEDVEFWNRNHLDDKGIWVDFKRDVIMVDTEERAGLFPKYADPNCLTLLAQFCLADLHRVERLALGGTLNSIFSILGQGTIWHCDLDIAYGMTQGMEMLRELWIDDEFKAEGKRDEYYSELVPRPSHYNRSIDPGGAQAKVEEFLRETTFSGRRSGTGDLSVRIIRGEDWHNQLSDYTG